MDEYWCYLVVIWCASSWCNYCVLEFEQRVIVKGVIFTVSEIVFTVVIAECVNRYVRDNSIMSESVLLTSVHVLYRHQCTCIILLWHSVLYMIVVNFRESDGPVFHGVCLLVWLTIIVVPSL